jgi:lipoprotein signal peptidase
MAQERNGRITSEGERATGGRTNPAGTHRLDSAGRKDRRRQRLTVLALLAVVIVVDQAAKWWGWRHVPGAKINPGGDFLTGPAVGRWYAAPGTGALLDVLDSGLVSIALTILARRRRPAAVTVCGSLMVGGWASNLLDRLGMHYWTAPGSLRGVVDFISMGGQRYNLADCVIIGTTPLFLLAAAWLGRRAVTRPATRAAPPAAGHGRRARAPVVAVAGAGLIMTVALGATHQGKLIRPLRHTAGCCEQAQPGRR